VDYAAATDKDPVVNFDITPEQHVIRQDYVVPQSGIVAQVRTNHEQIVRSDKRNRSFFRASMDGAVFPDNIVLTNLHPGAGIWIKAQILWERADHRSVPNPIILSDPD
jgi:hypothetical protein